MKSMGKWGICILLGAAALLLGSCKNSRMEPMEEKESLNEVVQGEEREWVVFVESLDPKECMSARLSFSTKITDYLKSGKCIFAVGVAEIAPIDYFLREGSACVASSREEIGQKLQALCAHPEQILEYGRLAFQCGERNHAQEKVARTLTETITEVSRHANHH